MYKPEKFFPFDISGDSVDQESGDSGDSVSLVFHLDIRVTNISLSHLTEGVKPERKASLFVTTSHGG